MPIPTNPDILRAVHTAYTTDLGLPEEWTDDQREEFIRTEAGKITWMARARAETLAEAGIRHWAQRNRQMPDPLTQSALRIASRAQAVHQVLSGELYELIAVDDD
ncbi:hypothetical protein ACOJVP_07205 [Mycobacterium sp. THU-M116]